MLDPFEILEVGYDADTTEIQLAYRRKARHLHPDSGGEAADFVQLSDAKSRVTAIRQAQRRDIAIRLASEALHVSRGPETLGARVGCGSHFGPLSELGWWLVASLAVQVIALSVVALSQPARPLLAVGAALCLGPIASTTYVLAMYLVRLASVNAQDDLSG